MSDFVGPVTQVPVPSGFFHDFLGQDVQETLTVPHGDPPGLLASTFPANIPGFPVDHPPTQARIQIMLPCSSRGVSIHEN